MAKVTPYQQRELASSLVGTPGVDNSASIIAGAMGQAQNSAANSILASNQNSAQTQNQLMNYANSEFAYARNVAAQAKQAQDKINADARLAEAGTQLQDQMVGLESDVRKDYINDTAGGMAFYTDKANKIKETFLASAGSTYERGAMAKDYGSKYDAGVQRMSSWATQRDSEIGQSQVFQSKGVLKNTLSNLEPGAAGLTAADDQIKSWLETNEGRVNMYMGASASQFAKTSVDEAKMAMLDSWSNTQPGLVTELAYGGKLKGFLTAAQVQTAVNSDHAALKMYNDVRQQQLDKEYYVQQTGMADATLEIPMMADSGNTKGATEAFQKQYEVLQAAKAVPEGNRNDAFITYATNALKGVLTTNRKIADVMYTKMKDDANFNRTFALEQIAVSNQQREADSRALQDVHKQGEPYRNEMYTKIDETMAKWNAASKGNKVASGVNATTLKGMVTDLMEKRNKGWLTEDEFQKFMKPIRGMDNTIFGKDNVGNLYAMFGDLHSMGPSDHLTNIMGITKTDANGVVTTPYRELKQQVHDQLEANIKASGQPENAIMSPAQKAAIYTKAQMDVLHRFIGANGINPSTGLPTVRAPEVKGEVMDRGTIFNPNQARETLRGGVKQVQPSAPRKGGPTKKSAMVPPPPATAVTSLGDMMSENDARSYIAQQREQEAAFFKKYPKLASEFQ